MAKKGNANNIDTRAEAADKISAEKEKKIKKEIKKIKELYKKLPKEKGELAEKLIERAAFMVVTMEEMEDIINNEGQIVEMPQGDYTINRAHPLLSAYNTMVKNFTAVVKQLDAFLEESGETSAPGQAFMQWRAGHKRGVK